VEMTCAAALSTRSSRQMGIFFETMLSVTIRFYFTTTLLQT
jgi:hypothetical protein